MQKSVGVEQDLKGLQCDLETAIKANKLGSINLNKYLGYELKPTAKLVCAKIVTSKDTIVECADCRMDSSCIICLDCFNNGDHKGHKYRMRNGAGGCCDCGDREAWKPSGFCKKHTGQAPTVEISKDKAERFVREWKLLFYLYFKSKSSQLGNYLCRFLRIFIENMEYNIMLTKFLTETFEVEKYPNLMDKAYQQPIIDSIFTLSIKQNQKAFEQLFVAMFPNYEFKKILILSYMKNFSYILKSKSPFETLSCQLLTSYELINYAITTCRNVLKFQRTQVDFQNQSPFEALRVHIHNMQYLAKLTNGVNIQYFKLFFENFNHLQDIAYYIESVELQWKDNHEDSLITDKFYIELQCLLRMIRIIRILRDDQQYMFETTVRLINHLKNKAYVNKCYFLLHRVLALFLFVVYEHSNTEHIDTINKLMNESPKIFFPFFRCIHFMISSRANKNIKDLHSDFFSYYVDYWHTAYAIDVFMVKLYIRLTSVKDFMDIYMLNGPESQYESYQMVQIKQLTEKTFDTVRTISCFLAFLTELCTSQCQQLHIYNKIYHQNGKYAEEVIRLLRLFLKSEKFVTEQSLRTFKRAYLNDQMNIDTELKELSKYDKNNKQYTLKSQENMYFPVQFFMSKPSVFKNADNDNRQIDKQAVKIDQNLVNILFNSYCISKIISIAENSVKLMDHKDEHQVNGCCMLIRQLVRIHYLTSNEDLLKILKDVSEEARILQSLNEQSKNYILQMHPKQEKAESSNIDKDRIREMQKKKMEAIKKNQLKFSQKNKDQLQKCEQQLVDSVDTCVYCHHSIDESMHFYCGCSTKNNITGEFRPFLTSCRHKLHYQCLKSYSANKNVLICPLCKRFSNILIPIWSKVELLDFENTKKKINEIVHFMRCIEIMSNGEKVEQTLLQGSTRLLLTIMDLLVYHAIHDTEYYNKRMKPLYQELFLTIKASTLFLFKKQSVQRKCAIWHTVSQINKKNLTEYEHAIIESLIQALDDNSKIPQILSKFNLQTERLNIITDFLKIEPIKGKQSMEVETTINQPIQFVKLPEKYMPLAQYRKQCKNCKKLGSPIHICLVCGWTGCMKCQVESLRKHANDKHGGCCLFLNVESTRYIMVGNGRVEVSDTTLYLNEIGKMFNIFQDWDDYNLDEEEYRRVKQLYVRQELPIQIMYKSQGKVIIQNFDDF